ncbi:hypothetical protein ACFOOP_05725 [Marinicaulis aureus]|uniref:SRPBCC domain-containing protein n=1 Tax=Hyphococcus aureus TaxID=2666033 RepID=A0ABW1KRW5_9PROT
MTASPIASTVAVEKPYRSKRTANFEIAAAPDAVFAMMCPVREYEWAPGWTTNLILSASGLVEQDCIFTTPAGASIASNNDSAEAIWVTPFHDPETRRLTMIKVTPKECVTRLDIAVDETNGGATVTASYEHTALSPKGRVIVDGHTEQSYAATMAEWRNALSSQLDAAA